MIAEIKDATVESERDTRKGLLPYEQPRLDVLGNVRDLVAGASGPYTDSDNGDPLAQNFPG